MESFLQSPMISPEEGEEGNTVMSANVQALTETSDDHDKVAEENQELHGISSFVTGLYNRAKNARQHDERRWIDAYRNFRGIYGPDVQFTDTEKSKAFIKITKTKVLAAYGKITSVLFAGNKFPLGVEATPVPEGIEESVHFDPKAPKDEKSAQGEAEQIPSTITRGDIHKNLKERLGPVKPLLDRLPSEVEIKSGPGLTPSSVTYEPAKIAATKMEKQMHDQLEETNASKHLRSFAFEMCLFGSGIIKGPFVKDKEYPRWDDKGNYTPVFKTIPEMDHVSVWNCYPDPDARSKEDCEFWIERHRLSKTQLRALKKRPYFRKESIEIAIEAGANYVEEYWESILDESTDSSSIDRYEVLEYWGTIDHEIAEREGIELPEEVEELEEFQVNIWVCNGQVLRFIVNPFTPARIPYYIAPYELNPYSLFGIGVAENMSDTQLIMNGFMRLAIDNAALSSNVVFEVDETNLVPGQDMSIYPGKVFRRQSGAPGQAIFATKYPNVTQECMLLFDKARQLSDEATGMPSYAHGMSGIMSTGRTASGMSMLMGAADENIKSVIRNIDDYLLIPFGQSLYSFNMQFNFNKDIKGDLTVVARGTERLVRNEIRSQKLLQFLQITGNEMDAPFVKRDYILRELAQSLDLDPSKIVNDPREAAIQAEQMKKMKEAMGIPEGGMEGIPATPPQAGMGGDSVGGGATPGASPDPGMEGFTGRTPPNLGGGQPIA